MSQQQEPSYQELKRRLEITESELKLLREGRVDATRGAQKALVERLAETAAREAHLKKVLLAIRNVNQLIVTEKDPGQLIRKACETLAGTMGYFNAWIALMEPDGPPGIMTASAGFHGGFEVIREEIECGKFTICMRRAFESENILVTSDPTSQCPDCPLAPFYTGRSGLSRRLEFEGKIYGILSVSVPGAFAQDTEEQAFFIELTNDLALALHKIEREREIHLKNYIIQTIPHPLSLVSADYGYLAVNKAYSNFYGVSAEEIVGRSIASFCGQEVFDTEIKPNIDRCLAGETIRYQVYVNFPGAGPCWMDMEYLPYRDENGRIVGIVSHGTNISEEKKLLTQIENQSQRMESLMQAIPAPVFFKDKSGRYLGCNPAFEALVGLTKTQIIGKSAHEIWPEKYSSTYKEKDVELIEQGGQQQYEFQLLNADGMERDVVFYKSTFKNNKGDVEGLVGVILDITDRKKQEEYISVLGYMLDKAPVSITVHDEGGRFLYANRMTFRLHGYDDEDEFMAIKLYDLDVPESRERIAERIQLVADKGEATFEVSHYRKDGTSFPLQVFAKAVQWEGRPAVLSIASDITERKRPSRH